MRRCIQGRSWPSRSGEIRQTHLGTRASAVDTSISDSPGPESGDVGPAQPARTLASQKGFARLRALVRGMPWDTRVFVLGYVLLLPFFLAPLFVTRLLPGLDLPFHMAAADLLSKLGRADNPYAPYYEGGLRLAPYAAHFVALVVLGKVMSLMSAHKLIIVLYVAGLPIATASLLGACRRSRIPALLAFPLAYNLTLHYGFVTFALSLPVLMWLLAEVTKLVGSDRRRVFALRWLYTAGIAALLFLCHLQNFLYGVCAACAFAVLSSAPLRRRFIAVTALVPAFVAMAIWYVGSKNQRGQAPPTLAMTWEFVKRHRLADLGRKPVLLDLWERLRLIPAHAMRAFADQSNVPACTALFFIVVGYIVIGVAVWIQSGRRADVRRERRHQMRLAGVIAFLGALVAYLALPHHLQELELMTFFPRFSVLVLLMLLLLVPAGLTRLRRSLVVCLAIPPVVLGMIYGVVLVKHYRMYGAEVAGFVNVVEKTPPGGKAMGLVFDRKSKVMQVESALLGLPGFYPAMRPAPGSMVPPMYCGLRHMPCRPKVGPQFVTSPWLPAQFSPAAMLPTFDYFFVRSLPHGFDLFRGYHGMVHLIARSGEWMVFGKRPGPVVPDPPPPAAQPPS
jgi:hypothetical protein